MFLPDQENRSSISRHWISFIFSCKNGALVQWPCGMNEIFYPSNNATKKREDFFFFLQYKKPSSSTFFTVNLPKHPHSEFVNNVPQSTLPFQSLVFNFLPVLSVIYLLIWQIFILCAGIYFMHWEKIVKTYLFPTSIELEVSLWWNLNLL